MKTIRMSRAAVALTIGAALSCAGCASLGRSPGQQLDPWENWNRKVFTFNEGLDEKVIKPVATGYRKVVPAFVRTGIGNVFNNIADGWSAINNLLQGKVEGAYYDTVRFTVNSAFGFLGILDIASEMGIDHQYEDFGQTLGHWGMRPGAYIVWPLLGPSTVRESVALPLDRSATPAVLFHDGSSQFSITALQIINTRANYLNASRVLDDIALDKYSFVRDAYLARRRSLVFDGNTSGDDGPPDAPGSGQAAPAPGR